MWFYRFSARLNAPASIRFSSSDTGESGAGGSVRQAGGAFGKREKAQEDQYFMRQQQEQLKKLRATVKEEISRYENQIKEAQAEINEAQKRIDELKQVHGDTLNH